MAKRKGKAVASKGEGSGVKRTKQAKKREKKDEDEPPQARAEEEDEGEQEQEEEQYEGVVEARDSDEESSASGGDKDDDEDDSDGEIALQGKGAGETVTVDLDFCDPNERFFHGVRALLEGFLPEVLDKRLVSELTELVVAQGAVGTVLSSEGEDDAFAVITALPLAFHGGKECVAAVRRHLLEQARAAGQGKELEGVIGEGASARVGLLLSERMVNVPVPAVPVLHGALQDDVKWALDNEISEEHKAKFKFDYYIVVAPCEADADAGARPPLSSLYFTRFDDEVLLQEATTFFTMPVPQEADGAGGAGPGGGSSGGGGKAGGGATAAAASSSRCLRAVGVVLADKYRGCAEAIAGLASGAA